MVSVRRVDTIADKWGHKRSLIAVDAMLVLIIAKRSPLKRCYDSLVTTKDYLCERRYLQSYIHVCILSISTIPWSLIGTLDSGE